MVEVHVYHISDKALTKKERHRLADALLLGLISEKTETAKEDLVFGRGPQGKPFLENQRDFCFNLSHSGDWIAIALSSKEVGVDVEFIRPRDYVNICHRYYARPEQYFVFKHTVEEQLAAFIDIWTLKESYLKMIGTGLAGGLLTYPIHVSDNNIQVENHQGDRAYFKQYQLAADYKLSVCALENQFAEELILMQEVK